MYKIIILEENFTGFKEQVWPALYMPCVPRKGERIRLGLDQDFFEREMAYCRVAKSKGLFFFRSENMAYIKKYRDRIVEVIQVEYATVMAGALENGLITDINVSVVLLP